MKILLAVIVAIGVLVVPTTRALACSCVGGGPAETAQRADAVFVGHVVAERAEGADLDPWGGTVYTFAVDGVAKGNVGARIEVVAGGEEDMCGLAFSRGARWLVFASREGDQLHSGLCSGSVVLEPGAAAPFELVDPVAAPDADGADVPVPLIVVVATAAFVILASWVAFRRTTPR